MTSILVVEDDTNLRNAMRNILRQAGYDVRTACNGQEATDLVRAESVDLMITDIIMPEKEGIETILEIRRLCTGIKIIAVSGGGEGGAAHYLEMAREFGANLTFPKPFSREELLRAVGLLVGHLAAHS